MVLAAEDARFCLSEVSLGLVPAVISPTWCAPWGCARPAPLLCAELSMR
jgi:methylglutaconyl-CoA hydratase